MTGHELTTSDETPALDHEALRLKEAMMGYGHEVIRIDSNGGRYVVIEEHEFDDTEADFAPIEIDPETM